jgi:ACS family hexuronate transporter-like MFS transporter
MEMRDLRSSATTQVNPELESDVVSKRWLILSLLFAITVINFIDRQTVSVLAPLIRQYFHLSAVAYGRIVAAFQFGMMSGELPMGWIMDRWGCRLGLCAAVLWWSAATGSQAFVGTGTRLGIARFWMGTSECGNYSGGVKVVSENFPLRERTLAIGIFNSGPVIGAVIAPPMIVFLQQRYGFRTAFLFPASLGAIWVVLWWFTYRAKKKTAREEEPPQLPLRVMLRRSSTWAVMLCRGLIGPVIQFYWYWLPSYLYTAEHMSIKQIGELSWIPFFLGGMGGVAGGWSAGWLQKRGLATPAVRKITMYASSGLCLASFIVPFLASAPISLLVMSVAIFGHNFLSANMFGAITDLFEQDATGRATGLSGVASGLTGLLFPLLTGFLVNAGSYKSVFMIAAVLPLLGTITLFVLARPYRRVVLQPEAQG